MRVRMYGSSVYSLDELLRLTESTKLQCQNRFATVVLEMLRDEYLRAQNEEEKRLLFLQTEQLGFLGILGSVDCCRWRWKNCPKGYHGRYKCKEGVPTTTMEAVSDDSLYFLLISIGVVGYNKDVTDFNAFTFSAKMSI